LESVTGLDRTGLATSQGPVPVAWLQQIEDLARRRASGEPLQYLTGVAGFRRLELRVGPGVFIPRPETETLVELALEKLPEGGSVVDLCTGSGAIALSLVDERPDAWVHATEASSLAFGWALKNRDALRLPATILQGDLFEPLPPELRGALDVVVSNPPYIADDEEGSLPLDVVAHEPHEALFSSPDGLSVIRRIAAEAVGWLRPDGWLLLEIGETQADPALDIAGVNGFHDAEVLPDPAGRPRVLRARWPGP
jgi:release factor glutamine methyltransferase